MERIKLTPSAITKAVEASAVIIEGGGVILFPTDTLYGLVADAFSDEAVDKVYEIKGRDEKKPMHCIVADIAMAEKYADISADALLLFERLLPGGLTLILPKRSGVDGGIARGIETIGIRIPNNEFCSQLARAFCKPFTATSANVAGKLPERSIKKILEQFSYASVLQKTSIELIIDAGELPTSQPSTVVDLSGEEPVILREGAIPVGDVWNAIRTEKDN